MNIEISAREYEALLDILHIADVVMSGHRRVEDKRFERHRALIQKFYAFAGGEGHGGLITYNDLVNKYMPTEDFEQKTPAHRAINEFEDHIFWDELISRLTARDAEQIAGGADHLNDMGDPERQALEGPLRQRYIAEFAANGVSNLEVVEHFAAAPGTLVKTSD